jgi:hypothetical protein
VIHVTEIKTRSTLRLRVLASAGALMIAASLIAPIAVLAISAPTVASASPTSLGQGAAGQNVVITGTGFVSGANASFSGAGITVNSTTYISPTNVSANVTISSGAAVGARTITVTNPDTGAGTGGTFTVNAAPTVTSASPASLGQGATAQNVGITGTGFASGAAATFSGTGITVNSTTFVSATSLTANVTITAGATPGLRNITVTNPDFGTGTGTAVFSVTVVISSPTVTSASPTSMGQGATAQNVGITGTGFASGAAATFSGTGITVNSTTFVSATQVTANLTISTSAATGARNVTVTNTDTGSGTGTGIFTVNAGPTVSSASPNNLNQGAAGQNVTITGTGFANGATVAFSGTGITVNLVSVASATSLTANVTIAAGATPGLRDITVTNLDFGAGTGVGKFTVNGVISTVTVTSATPSSLARGAVGQDVVIGGTGFAPSGAIVSFSGTGITLNSTTFMTTTGLLVNITISGSATLGARNITVTNPDTGSGTGIGIFTVTTGAGPIVTSASPDRLAQGATSQNVTIFGANFSTGLWNPANVSFSGTGIFVNSVSRNSSTSIVANISIATTAALGSRNITVVNPDGSGSGTGVGVFFVTSSLRLRFTSYPSSTTSSLLSPQPAVELIDVNGVRVTAAGDQVPIILTVNLNTASFTCTSGVTRTLVSGLATFTGCTLPAGTGYQITASPNLVGSTIAPVTGPAFTVLAKKLLFTQQPGGTNAAAGVAFPTQPVVAVVDASNVTQTAHNTGTITLSLATYPTGATLSCTGGNSKAIVNGLATFAGCMVSAAGTNYSILATYAPTAGEPTLPAITSNVFTVVATAAKLNLATSATIVNSGQGFTLSAQFSTGGSGLTVTFQKKAANDADWVTVGTVNATSTGLASLLWIPAYTAQYRASFAGGGGLPAVTSNVVSVTARFNSAFMTPNYTGTRTLARGTRVTYTATARPLNPANVTPTITFQIYKQIDGVWVFQTSATGPSNSNAMRAFAWTWNNSGTWYMRARINATAYNSALFSNIARVTIP